jgi:hypothetical protein
MAGEAIGGRGGFEIPALQLVFLFGPVWPVLLFIFACVADKAGTNAFQSARNFLTRNSALWMCCASSALMAVTCMCTPVITATLALFCSCAAFLAVAPDFANQRRLMGR